MNGNRDSLESLVVNFVIAVVKSLLLGKSYCGCGWVLVAACLARQPDVLPRLRAGEVMFPLPSSFQHFLPSITLILSFPSIALILSFSAIIFLTADSHPSTAIIPRTIPSSFAALPQLKWRRGYVHQLHESHSRRRLSRLRHIMLCHP
ncbi:hypothetical protein BJ875DRAFT_59601 [Amylocarpus encephaloides]|uniref:Uncharacterized protein n=1 Tax=Amylocarpus encephaloides TaxID=45428 RepID=A0A9P7YGK4_9HELO|nr:hypothetical protein BJ875DRAFT_59601 [Amylocarpus encephaloides]